MGDNALEPAVLVSRFAADRRDYDVGQPIALPALSKDLQIEYTATSLTVPERVRFRYRLRGVDADWQDAGSRREAMYNNLPPGNYRFQVIASNNDGLWNNTGATLDFVLAPAYWQTIWFKALVMTFALALLALAYSRRVRHVTAVVQGRMEERLAERERIARELHDTLYRGRTQWCCASKRSSTSLHRPSPCARSWRRPLSAPIRH